jgi:threonine synthase
VLAEEFVERFSCPETEQVQLFALRGASFVEACNAAADFGARRGLVLEGGFFNPAKREGLKTAYLEATEQVPGPIHWYVQPVSSAMGSYGTYKGAREFLACGRISVLPRLLCVQEATCCPMVTAFEAGAEKIRPQDIIAKPRGIATAILRGDPTKAYPLVRPIVIESGGTLKAVSEKEIREARRLAEELEGLSPCFTASSGLAAVLRMARTGEISKDETVMVNLTGGDRPTPTPPKDTHWLERSDAGWRPADPKDDVARDIWEGAA